MRLTEVYGELGGRLVPDCFFPVLDEMAERLGTALDGLSEAIVEDLAASPAVAFAPLAVVGDADSPVALGDGLALDLPLAAGWMVLARKVGFGAAVAGARRRSWAVALAVAARRSGVNLTIIPDREMGSDREFVRGLRETGAEVDGSMTADLFNEPSMYAFQRWFGNPLGLLFVPDGAGEGPYPFPAAAIEVARAALPAMALPEPWERLVFQPGRDYLAVAAGAGWAIPRGVVRHLMDAFGCLTYGIDVEGAGRIVTSPAVWEALAGGRVRLYETAEVPPRPEAGLVADARLAPLERGLALRVGLERDAIPVIVG